MEEDQFIRRESTWFMGIWVFFIDAFGIMRTAYLTSTRQDSILHPPQERKSADGLKGLLHNPWEILHIYNSRLTTFFLTKNLMGVL